MNYLLVDGLNMFMRAKHVGGRGQSIDMKIGMAMHIMFNSINKCWREFDGNHIVFCLEGRSWRKDFYTPYKANRKVIMDQRTVREQEDDELYFEAYDDMVKFFAEKTNVSVVRCETAEADDMIATWIQQHPEDNHFIISTDSDFYQLLAPNVTQYNGTTDQVVTLEGWKDLKTGEEVIDKKTKAPKTPIEPEWVLFEKCVRGDSSDNVFSAYPGARVKGTKNKTGMREAFEDRNTGGYNYNNFMLQRWVDHEGDEHRVKNDYERNKILIDLTEQPDEIKKLCVQRMNEGKQSEAVSNIGIHFMKFCAKWNLQRMSDQAQTYSGMLNGRAG
jgi:5'-3' exonuclease|tara:strand:- start:5513 stop:6502 length:990 start_codon:yes stop_codon:yes gene_type:complete